MKKIPEYIQCHSSRTPQGNLKVVFPRGKEKTPEDVKEQRRAKRWIHNHQGYCVREFWLLPLPLKRRNK